MSSKPVQVDNFDDFDDVLDEFHTNSLPASSSRPRANTRIEPPRPTAHEDELESSAFARELAQGMENLMKELGTQAGVDDAGKGELPKSMDEKTKTSGTETPRPNDFQSTIQETMRKLREGGNSDTSDPELQSIEAMLKDLGMGEDGGDENEMANVLETMMSQLMSKDILYEPLKELHGKFPAYLATLPKNEDRERYEKQSNCVGEVLKVFEAPGYSDSKVFDVKRVTDLMSEMQSYGSPPEAIMGPGLEGMPQLSDCVLM
ncbi:Pex19 protein [Hymenopellis radicata]|nr:Pex19 protein [Hymenopellis radicata]